MLYKNMCTIHYKISEDLRIEESIDIENWQKNILSSSNPIFLI
jgi:hypothetical protein